MNPLLPLAALGLGAGLYVYSKKTPAAKLAQKQAQQGAYLQASWDTHMSVGDVQHALNQLGAQPSLTEDGSLGPKTTAAIKSFQAQAGIAVDGVVGPQTETALHHALGGASTTVAGWFLMCDDYDDGEDAVGASAIERVDATRPGRGIRQAIEGGSMVGASWGGGDSSSWTSPDVAQILADPQQRMQIGFLEAQRARAAAAFPGSKAAGFDYSFLPDQGQSELAEYGSVFGDLEAERQAALDAVSGAYEDEEEFYADEADEEGEEDEELDYVGGDDWSAPDVQESYDDPYQAAQLEYQYEQAMQGYPGYPQPYYPNLGYTIPQQPVLSPPYLPYAQSNQGYYTQPGLVSGVPTGIGVTSMNQQGYEISGQPGRRY
jgi:hypothetical protein